MAAVNGGRRDPGEARQGADPAETRHDSPGEDPAGGSAPEDPGSGPPHTVPITDQMDLHSFLPRDIPDVVRDYLAAAVEAGFREVRLIHGKGIGAQRERVRALLAEHPDVETFGDAPAGRGHWGATVVRLRSGAPPGPRG